MASILKRAGRKLLDRRLETLCIYPECHAHPVTSCRNKQRHFSRRQFSSGSGSGGLERSLPQQKRVPISHTDSGDVDFEQVVSVKITDQDLLRSAIADKEPARAMEAFRKIVDARHEDPKDLNLVITLLFELNQFDNADKILESSSDRRGSAVPFMHLIEKAVEDVDILKAIEHFRWARRLQVPIDVVAYEKLVGGICQAKAMSPKDQNIHLETVLKHFWVTGLCPSDQMWTLLLEFWGVTAPDTTRALACLHSMKEFDCKPRLESLKKLETLASNARDALKTREKRQLSALVRAEFLKVFKTRRATRSRASKDAQKPQKVVPRRRRAVLKSFRQGESVEESGNVFAAAKSSAPKALGRIRVSTSDECDELDFAVKEHYRDLDKEYDEKFEAEKRREAAYMHFLSDYMQRMGGDVEISAAEVFDSDDDLDDEEEEDYYSEEEEEAEDESEDMLEETTAADASEGEEWVEALRSEEPGVVSAASSLSVEAVDVAKSSSSSDGIASILAAADAERLLDLHAAPECSILEQLRALNPNVEWKVDSSPFGQSDSHSSVDIHHHVAESADENTITPTASESIHNTAAQPSEDSERRPGE